MKNIPTSSEARFARIEIARSAMLRLGPMLRARGTSPAAGVALRRAIQHLDRALAGSVETDIRSALSGAAQELDAYLDAVRDSNRAGDREQMAVVTQIRETLVANESAHEPTHTSYAVGGTVQLPILGAVEFHEAPSPPVFPAHPPFPSAEPREQRPAILPDLEMVSVDVGTRGSERSGSEPPLGRAIAHVAEIAPLDAEDSATENTEEAHAADQRREKIETARLQFELARLQRWLLHRAALALSPEATWPDLANADSRLASLVQAISWGLRRHQDVQTRLARFHDLGLTAAALCAALWIARDEEWQGEHWIERLSSVSDDVEVGAIAFSIASAPEGSWLLSLRSALVAGPNSAMPHADLFLTCLSARGSLGSNDLWMIVDDERRSEQVRVGAALSLGLRVERQQSSQLLARARRSESDALRDALVWAAVVAGSRDALSLAQQLAAGDSVGPAILHVLALAGDDVDSDRLKVARASGAPFPYFIRGTVRPEEPLSSGMRMFRDAPWSIEAVADAVESPGDSLSARRWLALELCVRLGVPLTTPIDSSLPADHMNDALTNFSRVVRARDLRRVPRGNWLFQGAVLERRVR